MALTRTMLLLVAALTAWASAQSFKPMPSIPPNFQTMVELVRDERNDTDAFMEWYSESLQRAKRESVNSFGEVVFDVYDYKDNAHFNARETTRGELNRCTRRSISRSQDGATAAEFETVARLVSMLKDNAPSDEYLGVRPVRHILCNVWRRTGVEVFGSRTISSTVHYYFMHEDYNRHRQYPVRIDVNSTWTNTTSGSTFQLYHMYSFLGFRSIVPSAALLGIPRGVVCEGGNRTLPQVPHAFSVNFEVSFTRTSSDPNEAPFNITANYKALFDATRRVARTDSHHLLTGHPETIIIVSSDQSALIYNSTQIRDQNGIRSTICASETTEQSNLFEDFALRAMLSSNGHRLASAEHLLLLGLRNNSRHTNYQGVHEYRGIQCDYWVSLLLDWPMPGLNATVEWYYATSEWMYNNKRHLTDLRAPIHQRVTFSYLTTEGATHTGVRSTEFYDFNPRHITPAEIDVSQCPYGTSSASSGSSSSVSAGGAVAIALVCLLVGAVIAVVYVSRRRGKQAAMPASQHSFKAASAAPSVAEPVFEDDYE